MVIYEGLLMKLLKFLVATYNYGYCTQYIIITLAPVGHALVVNWILELTECHTI